MPQAVPTGRKRRQQQARCSGEQAREKKKAGEEPEDKLAKTPKEDPQCPAPCGYGRGATTAALAESVLLMPAPRVPLPRICITWTAYLRVDSKFYNSGAAFFLTL